MHCYELGSGRGSSRNTGRTSLPQEQLTGRIPRRSPSTYMSFESGDRISAVSCQGNDGHINEGNATVLTYMTTKGEAED